MKRKLMAVAAGVLTLAFAWTASAGPIPASPSPVPSAGESDLVSFPAPPGNVNVDWMVLDGTTIVGAGPGTFVYFYQLENTSPTSGANFNAFTVTMGPGVGTVLFGGVIAGDDLDVALAGIHPAHDVGAFAGLAGEEETVPFAALTGVSFKIDFGGNVTWTFDNVVGTETDTLFFVATSAPIYGVGQLSDSSPPSPWSTLAPGGDPVPIPTPEPASLLLLGLGLAGARLVASRRTKR